MKKANLTKHQEKTRLALMNAFLSLVAQKAIDEISVSEIAESADYGRWVFYQYFSGKEDIAWEAFTYWMSLLDVHILESVKHLPHPQREYHSWRIIFEAFNMQRDFFLRLGDMWQSSWYRKAKEFLVAQFLAHLQAGNFRLMDDVNPEIAARLYVVAIMELLEHWGRQPEIGDAESLVEEFFTFIFHHPPSSN